MRRIILALVVGLASGNAAGAETRTVVATSGAWTLYHVEGFEVAVGNHRHARIDGACVAGTGTSGVARLDFAAFPPELNAQDWDSAGLVFGQAASALWSFRTREADLVLGTRGMNLRVGGALYDDDMIMFNLGGDGTPPPELEMLTWAAEGPIEVIDPAGRTLAEFPSTGLEAMYRQMLVCAGLKPLQRDDLVETGN